MALYCGRAARVGLNDWRYGESLVGGLRQPNGKAAGQNPSAHTACLEAGSCSDLTSTCVGSNPVRFTADSLPLAPPIGLLGHSAAGGRRPSNMGACRSLNRRCSLRSRAEELRQGGNSWPQELPASATSLATSPRSAPAAGQVRDVLHGCLGASWDPSASWPGYTRRVSGSAVCTPVWAAERNAYDAHETITARDRHQGRAAALPPPLPPPPPPPSSFATFSPPCSCARHGDGSQRHPRHRPSGTLRDSAASLRRAGGLAAAAPAWGPGAPLPCLVLVLLHH